MLATQSRPDAPGAGKKNNLVCVLVKQVMTLTQLLNATKKAEFLAPLMFRLFLAPIFITFGLNKGMHFESTAQWFGNPDWGLGLPFPEVMAAAAISTEVIGGVCLLFGLLTRWISIPLMITMVVAMFAVHIQHGWHAVAPSDPNTNIAFVTQYVGFPGSTASLVQSEEVGQRLRGVRSLLKEHGDYDYLTEYGSLVVLNNGIEFAFIYFAMLLSLFFSGAGLISFDAFFVRKVMPRLMRLV